MSAPALTSRFTDALAYAVEVHAGHTRKGTEIPYAAHLLAVCALVLEHGGDEEQAIAALLHDAPEDHGGRPRLDDIRARFGERVADIVEACTDTFEDPKPAWRPRKEAYLAGLPDEPDDALLVSLADKVHNATSIARDYERLGDAIWGRFNAGADGQRWYYGELVRIFRERLPGPLAEELARAAGRFAAR